MVMMTNPSLLIPAGFAWGALLALAHFGGLWATLRVMPFAARPRLWFWGSWLVRFGLTLGGMLAAMKTGDMAIISACTGFFATRQFLIPRLIGLGK